MTAYAFSLLTVLYLVVDIYFSVWVQQKIGKAPYGAISAEPFASELTLGFRQKCAP